MSNQKPEDEKKEPIEEKTDKKEAVNNSEIEDLRKKEEPFEVSEEEEIEYLTSEDEDKDQACETGEPSKTIPGKLTDEGLINKLQQELKAKESEISQLQKQIEDLKDKFLRQLAELDNIRKRAEKEKEEYFQYALTDLLREILPIIDNFERALKTSDETDGRTFKDGVELIYRMLINLLKKYGVRPIELKDDKFDPAYHHALVSEESEEVQEPKIKEELQKGYLIHHRLLRPSMVKVIVPKKN
ncbi:MAG: nucleotide exchange factor GrpE [Candidatus Saccharicenans sp.]|nr:MAG: nucleotide exchange factor GrpE [Candidatus Aminicenantes bacterium]HEK86693.1 nucleotide exchange factor GrpE [Candidatus Aminicenantes bacterium]